LAVLRDRLDYGESLLYWSLGKCKTLLLATGSHVVCRSNKEGDSNCFSCPIGNWYSFYGVRVRKSYLWGIENRSSYESRGENTCYFNIFFNKNYFEKLATVILLLNIILMLQILHLLVKTEHLMNR
jgi:hypothetical protein